MVYGSAPPRRALSPDSPCQSPAFRIIMQRMHKVTVGIVGASGYSGVEAAKILAQHERVELKFVTSDRWEGDTLERRIGIPKPLGLLKFAPLKASAELAAGCQAVFLATPAEVSLELAPQLLEAGVRVIDLSGA